MYAQEYTCCVLSEGRFYFVFWHMSRFVWPMSRVMNCIGGLQSWASLPSTCLETSKEQCTNTESGCAVTAHCLESASDCDSSTLLEDFIFCSTYLLYVNLHVDQFEIELWIVSVVSNDNLLSPCEVLRNDRAMYKTHTEDVQRFGFRLRQLSFVGGFSLYKQRPRNSRSDIKNLGFSQSCCQQFERRPWACKFWVRLLILSWHVFGGLKICQGFISTLMICVLGFVWHSQNQGHFADDFVRRLVPSY